MVMWNGTLCTPWRFRIGESAVPRSLAGADLRPSRLSRGIVLDESQIALLFIYARSSAPSVWEQCRVTLDRMDKVG